MAESLSLIVELILEVLEFPFESFCTEESVEFI
jgi:hypothetical protein